MNKLTFAAVAVAAGVTSFATITAAEEIAGATPSQESAAGKCYVLGCYDAEGSKVDAKEGEIDTTVTASVAAGAGEAIAMAKSGKGTTGAKGGARFADLIARHAKANGVPVALARAVVRVESNFRVDARGRAGEVGLMQIKPTTARAMGFGGSTKALYNPDTNLRYGMKYLGLAQKLGDGSVCGTLLKYNAGHGAKRMNKMSAAYCSKVKRHLES